MNGKKTKIDFPLLMLKLTFLVLVFFLGTLSAVTNSQPFTFFQQGYLATMLLTMEVLQERSFLHSRSAYSGKGVVTRTAEADEGLTVVQGIFPGGPQLKLIDMAGNELHRWPVDFFAIWPDPAHLPENKTPKTPFHYHTQGMVVQPDGSVIVNAGDNGTAKLDKCGRVLWTVDRMTHHSITPDVDGGYWIPANRDVDEIPEALLFSRISRERLNRIPPTAHHGYENLILYIDDNGRVKKEFSVLQALYDAGFERELFDALEIEPTDPTHVNDVEIVTPELAARIDGVSAGDLLVSLRQMHMLVILDRNTGAVKWRFAGPWIRQHDPDITPAGNIVVFNNGNMELSLRRPPGSNLMELDPASGKVEVLYPK